MPKKIQGSLMTVLWDFTAIPNVAGVYAVYGRGNDVLYVGESTTIRTRIRAHLAYDNTSTGSEPAGYRREAATKVVW